MYGGLSRPTALDSDSPFAIANHALHDKSTPMAPVLKVPTRRVGVAGVGAGSGGASPGGGGGGGQVGTTLQGQQQFGGHQPYPPPSSSISASSSSSRHPPPPPPPPPPSGGGSNVPRSHPPPPNPSTLQQGDWRYPHVSPYPSSTTTPLQTSINPHHHQQPPVPGPGQPQGHHHHHQHQQGGGNGSGAGGMQSPGGGGGFGLREGAMDAYMGAGAYDSRTGKYGPPPSGYQQSQAQQGQHGQGGPTGGYYSQHQGSPQSLQPHQQQGYHRPSPTPTPAQLQSQSQQHYQHQQPSPSHPHPPNAPYPLTERHSAHSPRPQSPYTYATSPGATPSAGGGGGGYTPSPAQLSAASVAAAAAAASGGGPAGHINSPQSSSGGMYGPVLAGAGGAAAAAAGAGAGVIDPNQLSLQPRTDRGGQGRSGSKDNATGQELWEMFSSMDMRRTGQLGNKEVMELLSRDSRWRITPREDCVKMLMSIFDSDRSGFISFSEFEGLWAYIKDWHKIFLRFDRDNSGTIDRGELDQALQSFGYPLPRDLVRKLEKRFAPPKESEGSVPRGITFDRFLMACVTVKHFTEAFRRRDVRNEGRLTIDYNTFMDLVIDAPV